MTINNDDILEKLIKGHFKEFIKNLDGGNIITTYGIMLDYLMTFYPKEYHNFIYHRLTHTIVPRLEWMGILKRYKSYGKFYFKINKKNLK
jgi:hypothetical protein